ncbi:MAG: TolC family protein [Culturomica sp.]|jgi:outer membrane protein TolC|nr:TolC family protein [Culturomica sp.]
MTYNNVKKNLCVLTGIVFALSSPFLCRAQEKRILTLDEAIARARIYSSQALAARHTFRASYWNWRSFQADYLPSVSFSLNPSLNRSIESIILPDGSDSYVRRDQLTVNSSLNISQNVPLTGGRIYAESSLQRIDLLTDGSKAYRSMPVVIGYSQDLFGYNSQKWQRRIQPLRYTEAEKNYIEAMENVSRTAAQLFFALIVAQTSWEIARDNHANADTLYRIAQRRYERLGTITENDMLQLEINQLGAQTDRMNARMEVDDCMFELRRYLGLTDDVEIEAVPDEQIPLFEVDELLALEMALANNAESISLQRQLIESESSVSSARSQRGFQADFFMEFGLSQSAGTLQEAFRSPRQQEVVRLGFQIPILDWGVGKGRVKVAESNHERVQIEIEQNRIAFRQNIVKMVRQFNLQADKITIASKTDKTARRRYEVTQKLYLQGKVTTLELNAAISEKDAARRSYINSIYQFWNLYYNLRALTGYDFRRQAVITENFTTLIR